MSRNDVDECLKRQELIQGTLRINQRNYEEAYLDSPTGDDDADILIWGLKDRNRSLHGDTVIARLKPKQQWIVQQNLYRAHKESLEEGGSGEKKKEKKVEKLDETELEKKVAEMTEAVKAVDLGEQTTAQSQRTTKRRIRKLDDYPADEQALIPDSCLQKTAEVVLIAEKRHSRAAVGSLKPMNDGNRNWALFSPTDSRVPRMMIPADELPPEFFSQPEDFTKVIFIARLTDWPETAKYAHGKLCERLGMAGKFEAEMEGLLIQYQVDTRAFSVDALACLPDTSNGWTISQEEIEKRRDFRGELVFTIDPSFARYLDDALHVNALDDGTFEVGVHIADVSYFMAANSELDKWASNRATSVYVGTRVVPMLPRELTVDLCSLDAGVDRLTFSVVFKMNAKGEVTDEWFGRSLIHSVAKLSYDHAQSLIDEETLEGEEGGLPTLHGGRGAAELAVAVGRLHALAVQLRRRRFDAGALALNQPKLCFTLDAATGLPNGCSVHEHRDSNRLVEEFTLLTNMAVARRIYTAFPETAVLRRHPPPNRKMMRNVLEQSEKLGFRLDGQSAGGLHESLQRPHGSSSKASAISTFLTQLCARPMRKLSLSGEPSFSEGPPGELRLCFRSADVLCRDRRLVVGVLTELDVTLTAAPDDQPLKFLIFHAADCLKEHNVASALDVVQGEHQFENFPSRKTLLRQLVASGRLSSSANEFRDEYVRIFRLLAVKARPAERHLKLQTAYFVFFAGEYLRSALVDEQFAPDGSSSDASAFKADLSAIIHSLAQAVFGCCQQKLKVLNDEQALAPRAVEQVVQDDTVLYLIAGGTMAQTLRSYRRREMKQRASASWKALGQVTELVGAMKMNAADTLKVGNVYLLTRDRGFMYVPKSDFLPLLQRISKLIHFELTESEFGSVGENLIAETMAKVQAEYPSLLKSFRQQLKNQLHLKREARLRASDGIVEEFFKTWVRKICHANFGQFFKIHWAVETEQRRVRQKGGQNLRTALYGLF